MRAPLNIDEFSAMAFIRSSLPTISTRNDCRAGISKAFTTPRSEASTKMCHTCTTPVRVSVAKIAARIIDEIWVAITRRWRLNRSATIPPSGATRNTGNWLANPAVPNNRGDPVMR